ncbi:phosphomevalonate kinase, peroxisomal isoform X1 [Silene latifolia]|uniref:phosphomevalonate kinase, peroxisomal isoform X1 n=1 Tax=Silene latifolia TaxID=37657 RepID=UPI003D7894BF
MEVVASAPGKVLMTGGYLVLERPNAGLVLSTNARFYAIVKPFYDDDKADCWAWSWMDVKLTAPQLSRETMYKMSINNFILQCVSSSVARNPFVEQALQYVVATAYARADKDKKDSLEKLLRRGLDITIMGANEFYSYRDQLEARGLPLAPESLAALPPFLSITFNADNSNVANCKPEVAKTGLGSSAAMTTAVVAALLHYLGIVNLSGLNSAHHEETRSNKDLDLVHMLAQTSHCMAQGKVGSGFDVSCAVYGSQRYVRFSPEVLSSAQIAGIGSLLQEVIIDVIDGKWNHEITKFSLPPRMTLVLGEPGSGGSSTPSMVGAVKKWQKSEPEKSLYTWTKLSEANVLLEKQLNKLSELAEQKHEAYESIIDRCSMQKSEKWMEHATGPSEQSIVEALIAARNAMLDIRSHMRHMGEAAGVPIEPDTQTRLLDATLDTEGVLLAGIPGAGGFDAVFAITLGSSTSKVAESWSLHNVLALPVREDPHGVCLEGGDPRLQDITVGVSSATID